MFSIKKVYYLTIIFQNENLNSLYFFNYTILIFHSRKGNGCFTKKVKKITAYFNTNKRTNDNKSKIRMYYSLLYDNLQ